MATSAWSSCASPCADEIANVLTYTRTLDVRPSSHHPEVCRATMSIRRRWAAKLRVANVSDRALPEAGRQPAGNAGSHPGAMTNRLLWQTSCHRTRPGPDRLADRQWRPRCAGDCSRPSVSREVSLDTGTRPKNPEAYDLYLHSLPCPMIRAQQGRHRGAGARRGDGPELRARLGGTGPALLLRRDYSDGGEEMFQRSNKACERALALDPNRIVAAGQLITNRVERGELGRAYEAAQALVKRRPESAMAHFVMGYVLRYGGMLEQRGERMRHRAGPGSRQTISSAPAPGPSWSWARPSGRSTYVRLDAGSEWAAYVTAFDSSARGQGCRSARSGKADAVCSSLSPRSAGSLSCSCGPPRSWTASRMRPKPRRPADPDPELWYYQGALLALCGKDEAALHMLQSAVQQNYCAYSNLLNDPLLAKLRAAGL